VNDWIDSRDENDGSGDIVAKRVGANFIRYAGILQPHINGEVMRTTDEHPFSVQHVNWMKAPLLQPGSRIVCADETITTIENILHFRILNSRNAFSERISTIL